jgi:1,4-alpha-glucan branching enzyme
MTSIRDDGTVEFRFYRPSASLVSLAGDFCAWAARAIAMQPQGDGWWTTRLRLDGGEYRFRYIADGNWFTDFASHGIEICKHGWNSVLLVPEIERKAPEPPAKPSEKIKIKARFAA